MSQSAAPPEASKPSAPPSKSNGKPVRILVRVNEASRPSSPPLKENNEPKSPKDVLKWMLSHNPIESKNPFFTTEEQEEPAQPAKHCIDRTYRVIGRGACGTIFDQTGFGSVFKHATDPSPDELWNDCTVHVAVAEALGSLDLRVQVPVCNYFVLATDSEWWDSHLEKFPTRFQIPSHVLCTERIRPLQLVVRNALTDLYCPPAKISHAKNDDANKDCLVRLYLGKRWTSEVPSRFFTLRNMILHLDQMEFLELDVHHYAQLMADTLAVIHWKAKFDGRDIEFVLGSAPAAVRHRLDRHDLGDNKGLAQSTWKKGMNITSFTNPMVHLWVLDFNQCRRLSMDDAGIELAVEAFFLNDPYYPRPATGMDRDEELWRVFRDRYLERSREVIDKKEEGPEEVELSMPERFIERVVERQQERMMGRMENRVLELIM